MHVILYAYSTNNKSGRFNNQATVWRPPSIKIPKLVSLLAVLAHVAYDTLFDEIVLHKVVAQQ